MSVLWKIAAHWKGAAGGGKRDMLVWRLSFRCWGMVWNGTGWEKGEHTMLCLTGGTMTQFTIQRLLSTQLIRNFPTMATCLVPRLEVALVLVDLVWWSCFPFVDALY